ncbi:MAG: hypothetical protein CL868_15160 [Cytophagaceae bacterium]|nr:hypothetical protein [Cytophagaceae bacterium]|tara:strand:- start:5320 stop:5520 length:201 start_codon:yes stop_codon:yes gene_type:complete
MHKVYSYIFFTCIAFAKANAQTATPQETVKQFFDAMHTRDTPLLWSMVTTGVILQTSIVKTGEARR